MVRNNRIALATLAVLVLLAPSAGSQAPDPAATPTPTAPAAPPSKVSTKAADLRAAVDTLVGSVDDMGGSVTVAIIDVDSGEVLAGKNAQKALNPASNAKLLTAATALAKLGPSHRFFTSVYGKQKGPHTGTLVLRGTGDPSLSTADLWEIAHDLKEAGVKKIDGDILIDQKFFDEAFTPPAFDQQPNEWSSFRAPVAALSVNENTVTLTVRPGTAGGGATATFDPPGFVDVEGQVKTVEGSAAQNVVLTLTPQGTRLLAHLSGSIPESSHALSFTRRVDDPRLLAGFAFKAILADFGISISGDVKLGGDHVKGAALSTHKSRPLSTLLYELGKQSDNFYAEMVFKALSLEEKGRPAKAGSSADVVTGYLTEIGALEDGVVVKNGSGLFDANRVSANAMTKLLRSAFRDPGISNEYVAQLSIGGEDGTLRHRFRDSKSKHVVRAKTGTLEGVASLSGYVLAPPDKGPIAFSIIVNGIAGKVSNARQAIDKCVDAISTHLWK